MKFWGYNRNIWTKDVWSKMHLLPKWLKSVIRVILQHHLKIDGNQIYSLLEFIIPKRYRMRLPGEKLQNVKNSSALNVEELYYSLTSIWNNAESGSGFEKNSNQVLSTI